MQNNRRRRRTISSKAFVLLLALVLVFGVAAGGTVAWLVAKTGPVTNTFTYGDINIDLSETTGDSYKIIPGVDIAKDPKVTVKANSEACYLFVKVEEAGTFVDGKVTYSIAEGWTKGDGTNIPADVYYRVVEAADAKAGASYGVLAGDKVTVSEELTKADIATITAENQPKLIFTAYAVQKDGITDAAAAWAKVNP